MLWVSTPPPGSQAAPSRMQLTVRAIRRTPQGVSLLVHAMFALYMTTRRAQSPHFRDTGEGLWSKGLRPCVL